MRMPRLAYGPDRSGYDWVSTWNSRMACVGSVPRMSCIARVNSEFAARAGGLRNHAGRRAQRLPRAAWILRRAGVVGSAGTAMDGSGAFRGRRRRRAPAHRTTLAMHSVLP